MLDTDARGRRARESLYDEAFIKAGHGLWQYILLLQCGWANASDAIEILCVSFILPHIKRDMKISYASLSGLTFALFFGMMVGGYMWGSIADSRGRRKTMCLSLAVNAVFGILSGVSPNYPVFVLFRFLSGVGAGGSLPVCFTYFSEFQQMKRRGAMISALAMCWMIGNIISGLLAWLILPDSAYIASLSPYGQQWRLFTILCGIPSLSSSLLMAYMPESPKFLYSTGKYAQSLFVLSIMFDWNHRGKNDGFGIDILSHNDGDLSFDDEENVTLLQSTEFTEDIKEVPIENARQSSRTTLGRFKIGYKSWKAQMNQIFSPVRRAHSVAIMLISVLFAFGGYGMAMWMPVLMDRAERYDGSPCEIRGSFPSNSTQPESSTVYVDILIGFLGQLPGNIVIILLMDRVGSKFMIISSSFLSGLSVFFFWFTSSKATVIAMNSIYNGISVGCWDALDVITVEIYPTNIRSAAIGNSSGISRIGSILGTAIFGLFMDSSCNVPIITVFVAYTLSGLCGFKLPNMRGRALQ